jgi:type I restriction enzyme S subunit
MNQKVPASWAIAPLCQIADVQLGKMLSAKARTGRGARPYLRNINVRWHRVDTSDILQMDFDARELEKYRLEAGDVLVCEGGEPGRAAVWQEQLSGALYQKALHRVRIRGSLLNPQLLAYQLELAAADGSLAGSFTGSTIKHLPREAFIEWRVAVPPLAEQCRIVAALEEHLSDLDAAVRALERAKSSSLRYSAAVLSAAMHGRLDEESASRLSAADDGVFPLSEGWRWGTLGDFLSAIEAGASFKCEERPPRDGETGIVKVSAVTWGTYDEEQSKTVRDSERIDDRLLVVPGDFLFSRANTLQLVGACVIAEKVTRRVMLSDKILRFRFRNIDPRWVLTCLRSKWGRSEIERLATGNQESMRNIGQERIRAIRIPVPPLEDQQRIVVEVERRTEGGQRAADEIDIQLARAKRLRRAILKHAFEGKLVPQAPSDEPASELLARLRDPSEPATHSAVRTPGRRARPTARRGNA